VRAATNVVEAGDGPVAVRLTEVGRLLQRRFDGESIPVRSEELVAEGERRPRALHHDRIAQARKAPVLQPLQGAIAHAWLGFGPVVAGAQVWHREENGNGIAPWWCHLGLRARRRMDVDGVAAWHATVAGHILDEAVIVITNHQGVVQELLKLLVSAQIHHVGRHCGAQRSKSPWEGVRCIGEERVTRRDIAVVDYKAGVVHNTIGGSHASGAPVAMQDLIHLVIGVNGAAHLGDDLAERLDDAVHAALGVPDPISNL